MMTQLTCCRILLGLMFTTCTHFLLAEDKPSAALDEKAKTSDRLEAIRELKTVSFESARPILAKCFKVQQPLLVQQAALETLGTFEKATAAEMIFEVWPEMTPAIRTSVLDIMISKNFWRIALLDAVEKGTVRSVDLEPSHIGQLLRSKEEIIRIRSAKVFAATPSASRSEAVTKYRKALDLKGDAVKGRVVFKDNCIVCHKLGGIGESVGPDLQAIKDRKPVSLLTGILDPNRDVLPKYNSYLLITDDDRIFTGIISAEGTDTVTIRQTDGTAATIRRSGIQSLRSTGLSAMPEGFEEKISLESMADLLAFLAVSK